MGDWTDLSVDSGDGWIRIVSVRTHPDGAIDIELDEGDGKRTIYLTQMEKKQLQQFLDSGVTE